MAVYHNGARYVACLNGASFTTLSDHTTHSLVATYAEMQTYIGSMSAPIATISGTNVIVTFTPFTGKYLNYIAQNQTQLPSIKTQVMIQPCHYGPRSVDGGWHYKRKNHTRQHRKSARYVCGGTNLGQENVPFTMHFLTIQHNTTVLKPIVLTAASAAAGSVTLIGYGIACPFADSHCTDGSARQSGRMGYAVSLNKSGGQSLGAYKESNLL